MNVDEQINMVHGDNREVLQVLTLNENSPQFDLVYLDPPFFSGRNFGEFDDRWECPEEGEYTCETCDADPLMQMIKLSHSPEMAHYISYMNGVLSSIFPLTRESATVYLHCDDSAVHYLRMLLDLHMGSDSFLSHVVWKRSHNNSTSNKILGRISDHILVYAVSPEGKYKFNIVRLSRINQKTIDEWYVHEDEKGRYNARHLYHSRHYDKEIDPPWRGVEIKGHWLVPVPLARRYEEQTGKKLEGSIMERLDILADAGYIFWKKNGSPYWRDYVSDAKPAKVNNLWIDEDVPPLGRRNKMDYPTEKPVKLMKRILAVSTDEGDMVLDPFMGSGSMGMAALEMGRNYMGIDINDKAVQIAMKRIAGWKGQQMLLKEANFA